MYLYLLTELTRLLEQRGYLFPTDPSIVTENLRQTHDDLPRKCHRRAQLLDRDHRIQDRLNGYVQRWRYLGHALTLAYFLMGWLGMYALMQHTRLNFFVILIGVLGINTVTLLIWLGKYILRRPPTPLPSHLIFWEKKNDEIGESLAKLNAQIANTPYIHWRKNVWIHQFALFGLVGMLLAATVLLTVRQYSFNWESTLLSPETLGQIVAILAWLPEKLGFSAPDLNAIIAGRHPQQNDWANAASWGYLLLSSVLIYGCFPRILAWGFSQIQANKHALTLDTLDIQQPYYQNLAQKWQRQITDSSADYRPDPISMTPPSIALSETGRHWAVLLDAPHHDAHWFEHALGQNWLDKGLLAEREQFQLFLNELNQYDVQLLVGVRAHYAPDRGVVRQLNRLAQQAKSGLVVKLLLPSQTDVLSEELLIQWQNILQEHGWAWLK